MWADLPKQADETTEWALTVMDGRSAGTTLSWRQAEVVLGRAAAGSALFRGDAAVSRRHAVLRRGFGGTCTVEDLGSTNGTFVNGQPVKRLAILAPDDELRIGRTRLRVTLAPAVEAGTAVAGAVAGDGLAADGLAADEMAGWPGRPGQMTDDDGTGPRHRRKERGRTAGQLTLSVLAAIAGTVLASALNGSPQLKLVAAAVGAAVPAFVTEPGRYQRQRAVAAVLLMAGALFLIYGGATLFSYAAQQAAIYPLPPAVPPPAPQATPKGTAPGGGTGPPSGTPTAPVTPDVSPTMTATPTATPTITATPTPSPTTPTPVPTMTPIVTSSPAPPVP